MGNQTSIPAGYIKCADEGSQCQIKRSPMPTVLYYGGETTYKMITFPPNTISDTNVACNNQTLGGDPLTGKPKACYIPTHQPLEQRPFCDIIINTSENDNERNEKYTFDCKSKRKINADVTSMSTPQNPEHFINLNLRERYNSIDYRQLLLVIIVLLILYLVYNNCNQ
jgi:hypothetical protein